MLKKSLLCLSGIIIGNIIVVGISGLIMLIKKLQVETNRFWETASWFKYSVILDIIHILIFILIIIGLSKILKFEFIKPNTNFLILGFLYPTLGTLLSYYFVDPLFDILEKKENVHLFMEYISGIIHLPIITMMSVTIVPFVIFLVTLFVYNYFFISLLSRKH